MAYEIEYNLSGNDPHVYRLQTRYESCEDAAIAAQLFIETLAEYEKKHGLVVKIIWVD